jgi:DNA-binding MarR family transcriptional regulator
MAREKEQLVIAVKRLISIKNECSCTIISEYGIPEITVHQARYLKAIDQNSAVTFSRLAEITRTSKPTITEMINRFVSMDCVYRERSPDDRRVQYIRLTEKGRMIARAEENALARLIERMMHSLDEDEARALAEILRKVR